MATIGIGLNQPFVVSGAARTYFFNGRVLSAEDLQREQALREGGQRRFAQLFGCGIERGLMLGWSAGSSELTVSAGLGVTPSGELIETGPFTLDLAAAAQAGPSAGFATCAAAFGGGGARSGVYLLALTPAWIADGRAPTLLGEGGACNRNVELPAVRARLVPLNPPPGALGAVDERNQFAVALLAPTAGSVSQMRGWWPSSVVPALGADDLPIALLKIDLKAQVEWADPEAARRRLHPPPGSAADALWPRSRRIEMEAFARQFTAQLRAAGAADVAPAPESFSTLPPVLVLDADTQEAWYRVFGDSLDSSVDSVDHEGFALALEGGLYGEPVARDLASGRSLILYRTALWVRRLSVRSDLDPAGPP
jgi:hypothetical protein